MYRLKECRDWYSDYATGSKTEELLFDFWHWHYSLSEERLDRSVAHPALV